MNHLAEMSNAIRAERERGKAEALADFTSRFARFAATRCQSAKKAGESASVEGGINTPPPPPNGETGTYGASDVPPQTEHTEGEYAGEVTDTVANAETAGATTTEHTEQTDTPSADGEAAETGAEAEQDAGQHMEEQQNAETEEPAPVATDAPEVQAPARRKRRGINFMNGGHK